MGVREEAIFIHGVYRGVIEGILLVQEQVPEHIMFLQPHSAERIVHLADRPPSVEDRVQLFLSTTEELSIVCYTGEIVGWDNKTTLPETKVNVVSRLLWTLQPQEGGLYHVGGREKAKSTNLLHVWRMVELRTPFSVTELILTSTGEPHSPDRTTARRTNPKHLEGAMTREEKIAVVESYIHGLGNGDFSNVPFAEDVSYESPLTPKRTGQDAIAFLSALFPIMRGAEVQQHIVEGDYVATVFHLRTPNGVTVVFDKFRVVDGKLKEINPYYDPSVLNEAVKLL